MENKIFEVATLLSSDKIVLQNIRQFSQALKLEETGSLQREAEFRRKNITAYEYISELLENLKSEQPENFTPQKLSALLHSIGCKAAAIALCKEFNILPPRETETLVSVTAPVANVRPVMYIQASQLQETMEYESDPYYLPLLK